MLSNSRSGVVFVDTNNDGRPDDGELGIPGALITISGTTDSDVPFTDSVLSGDDGSYQFDDVPAGTYDVTQQQPAAMRDGTASAGAHGGTAGVNETTGVVLGGEQTAAEYNFG